jgi:hypothetical protein
MVQQWVKKHLLARVLQWTALARIGKSISCLSAPFDYVSEGLIESL